MEMQNKIKAALDTVRPFLNADGGDLEFVSVVKNKVTIRLTGACSACSMSEMTLKAGIEAAVKNAVPEITEVIAI